MMRCVFIFLLLLVQLLSLQQASAERFSPSDMAAFETLPILHEGRVKPLSSFAKVLLTRFSGQDHVPHTDISASAWLAHTIFEPVKAVDTRIFKISDRDLKARLGLEVSAQRFYSLSELTDAIDRTQAQALAMTRKPREELSPEQIRMLDLHEHILVYQQLLRATSALNALPEGIKALLPFDAGARNYLEIKQQLKGRSLDRLPTEATLVLRTIERGGEKSDLFRVLPRPSSVDGKSQQDVVSIWVSPWSSLLQGVPTEIEQELMLQWAGLATAYGDGQRRAWRESLRNMHGLIAPYTKQHILAWERYYNEVEPYFWSAVFYALALVFICLWFASSGRAMFYRPAALSLGVAVFAHLGGLVVRIMILERPPVGTLYESALFVAIIMTGIATFIEWKRRDGLFLTMAALTGCLLLSFAPQLIPQADSKPVLMAVLNSGFWLGTHVLVITAGYGVAILAGCLAHGMLLLKDPDRYRPALHMILLAALSLTAIGTILGGIWADQSWGRFWGWDPKENGALLIVLWIVWLLHARLSGDLRGSAYLCVIAALNIVVALAWFGVNFLGIGLHSYGFISGVGYPLGVFILFEILVIYGLYCYSIKRVERKGIDE